MQFGTKYLFLSLIISGFIPSAHAENLDKCGPYLRQTLQGQSGPVLSSYSDRILDIRIQAENPDLIRQAGITIRSVNGPYITAYAPLSRIPELLALPEVKSVRQALPCFLSLDKSMLEIGLTGVHEGSAGTPYSGQGVIIGIIDTGIDWKHEDFITMEGKTRILLIWDQTLDTYQGERHIYTKNQIQNALDSGDYSSVQGKDLNGHGTLVAGIAAGNGRAAGNGESSGVYIGGAPEASLIIVKVSDGISMTDSQVEDAVAFIFEQADNYGLPCVINLSLGRRNGSRDGQDSFELGMNNYLWEPGRAIVVAAGNDGGQNIHVQHEFNPFIEDTLRVMLQINLNNTEITDQVSFEGWINQYSSTAVTVVNPSGDRFGPVQAGALISWPENGTPYVYIDNGSGIPNPYNGDKQILIQFGDTGNGMEIETGIWELLFHNGSDRLDLWLVNNTTGAEIISETVPTSLLYEPAHALYVIAVGSTISRTQWPSLWQNPWSPGELTVGEISAISSPGPSRRNSLGTQTENKPEITAPGEYILSSFSDWTQSWPGDPYMATDSVHRAWTGTSFAAPHVTGLIACMFESDPGLDASDIKYYLAVTARHDAFTGDDTWSPIYGFGKTDALAAMLETSVKGKKTVADPDEFTLIHCYPNPFNLSLNIEIKAADRIKFPIEIEIRNISGQMVKVLKPEFAAATRIRARWDGKGQDGRILPTGLYLITLRMPHIVINKKITMLR